MMSEHQDKGEQMNVSVPRPMLLGAILAMTCLPPLVRAASTQAPVPLKDFVRRPLVSDPALSPDGRFLAVRMDDKDGKHHAIVVYRLSDMKIASVIKMPIYQMPGDITWISPSRLAVEKEQAMGSLDIPYATGDILATNYDGKYQRFLYGYNDKAQLEATDWGWGFIAGTPYTPNGHVYVDAYPYDSQDTSLLLDINSMHATRSVVGNIHQAGMDFLVNRAGKATFAYGNDTQLKYEAFRRIDGRWQSLPKAIVGSYFEPIAYTPDEKQIYALSSHDGGPYQLVMAKADASDPQALMADPFFDFGDLQWTPKPYRPFAVVNATGIPQPYYINTNLPVAKLYMALSKAFPGQFVDFDNYTEDGMELLFETYSDRNPGTYFLIDRHTNKVTKLFDVAPWIHPTQMSERQPFRFKASDGMELEGILTWPRGRRHSNLPMVLMAHGGPYGIQDTWGMNNFDGWEAQMLASRGYLVLQVNFRGSGGRGPGFEQAGYKQWGTGMQQDLLDGVKWAIAHHAADPARICVYGGSYGGYAALMQVIRAPQMYKGAISYDGVTDLDMQIEKSDTGQSEDGRNYFRKVLGATAKIREANSPVDLVDKIRVPVFLIHGKDDKRVPYDEATEMRDALEKAGKKYQWMAKSGERHGFYDANDNMQRITRILAFLKQNIGPGAPAQAAH